MVKNMLNNMERQPMVVTINTRHEYMVGTLDVLDDSRTDFTSSFKAMALRESSCGTMAKELSMDNA